MSQRPPTRPHFALATPRGAVSYGLGFLAYLPAPFFSMIVAGIVMAAVYPSQKRHGGLAAENGRRAANWGLTIVALMVVIAGSFIWLSIAGESSASLAGAAGIPLLGYLVLSVVHVVVILIGFLRANSNRIFNNPLAINFLR